MVRSCLLICLGMLLGWTDLHAQGCSDAGFCTMGALKPDQPFNKKIEFKLRSMELSYYRGTTTLTPIITVITADLNFSLNSKNSFQVKLPYQSAEGTLGHTSGVGDISLCYTRNIVTKDRYDINISVGGKIPSNASDKTSPEGLPLPMYYQTSLGTYDVIGGISLVSRNWLLATGIQHPFNENNNQFLWKPWEASTHDMWYVVKYAKAKNLQRGTDVMLRAERNFRFSRVNFSLGLLPIFRITEDEITNPSGEREKVKGTTGMALSGIATAGYNFNVRSGMRLLVGRRLKQREVNTDGLSRILVLTASYYYRF